MVLKQLEVFRFKKFGHQKFQFQPGLNIIRGANESGKSSLRQALLIAFFGNPTSVSEALDGLTTWGKNERCELRLNFEDERGAQYQLRKDFAAKKIYLVKDQESFVTWKSIQTMLHEVLGIASEEVYLLCASLDVRLLSNLGTQTSRKQVGKMLASLMTGTTSGQDVIQALKQLDEAIRELNKGEGTAAVKNPGPLRQAKEQLNLLISRKVEAEEKLRQQEKRSLEFDALLQQLNREQKELADLEYLLAANQKLVNAEKRKAELAVQEADLDITQRIHGKLTHEIKECEQQLERFAVAGWNQAEIERLRQLQVRWDALERKALNAFVINPSHRLYSAVGLGLLVVGLGIYFSQAVWAIIVGIGGIFLLWRGISGLFTERQKKQAHDKLRQEYDIEKKILEQELDSVRQNSGGLELKSIFHQWSEYQQKRFEKEALERRLQESPMVDQERWKNLRQEIRVLDDVLNDMELLPLKLLPPVMASKQREFQILEKQVTNRLEHKNQLQGLVRNETGDLEQLLGMEEQIQVVRERIEYLQQREIICRRTYQLLDQARRDTLNPARQILEQRAGELLKQFSRGRYSHIVVDDDDLSSKIFLDATGRWEDPDVLSQGAFDQFYLSLRLALAEIITQGKKTPLLLDEPLSAFDAQRTQATLEQLKMIARERQVLFFTCKTEYDSMADHLLVLE